MDMTTQLDMPAYTRSKPDTPDSIKKVTDATKSPLKGEGTIQQLQVFELET